MNEIKRESPVRFPVSPKQSELRDNWTVALEYDEEGQGPWLVDLACLLVGLSAFLVLAFYQIDLPGVHTDEAMEIYRETVIPYWKGRSMRERVFRQVPDQWRRTYSAGVFTEFMEQRAPGHTTLDGIIYRKGMLDFKAEIAASLQRLDYLNDPESSDKSEELTAMNIACDAAIIFGQRHAERIVLWPVDQGPGLWHLCLGSPRYWPDNGGRAFP